jgi:hypothetical protein
MRAFKWKDRIEVNGSVHFSEAGVARGIAKPFYTVQFRRSHRRDWDGVRTSDTLAGAKQLAQDDHDERQADVVTESAA